MIPAAAPLITIPRIARSAAGEIESTDAYRGTGLASLSGQVAPRRA